MNNSSTMSPQAIEFYEENLASVKREKCHTLEQNRYGVKVSFNRLPELKSFLLECAILDCNTGCFLWKRGCHERGYGIIRVDRQAYAVHRLSAHLYKGFDLKSDLFVCHTCDNPRCFRPSHLFIGTHADNMRDAVTKRKRRKVNGLLLRFN